MEKRADYNGLDGGRLKRRQLEKSKNYAMIENPVTEMPAGRIRCPLCKQNQNIKPNMLLLGGKALTKAANAKIIQEEALKFGIEVMF